MRFGRDFADPNPALLQNRAGTFTGPLHGQHDGAHIRPLLFFLIVFSE